MLLQNKTLQILTLKMKPLQDSSHSDNFTAVNNKLTQYALLTCQLLPW